MKTPARYIVRDVRTTQMSGLGREKREPYQVLDTQTNAIIDEYSTKRPATMHAQQLNAALQHDTLREID